MYLYFDRNKVLREIINDEAIVQGLNRNKIFIYYELQGDSPLTFNSGKFRKPDGTEVDILQQSEVTTISDLTSDSAKIPYNPDRDLKFFKYGKGYPFTVITVNNAVYSIDGVVLGTVNVTVSGYASETLERFTFMVEETNGIEMSEPLDFSMFEYLVELFSNKNVIAVRGIPADVSIYNADDVLVNLSDKKLYVVTGNPKVASMWLDLSDLATETDLLALTIIVNSHIANKSNPHEVTKAQVGLGNVDNTSDLDKPISTATQQALNGKTTEAWVQAFVSGVISTVRQNSFLVVESLPETGEEGIIYLILIDAERPEDGYYEYIYEGNDWLLIGATTINLSNYYTKGQTNTLLAGKQDTMTTITTSEWNTMIGD